MKHFILLSAFAFSALIIKAQNYSVERFIGDDDDYWSGATEYTFLYPTYNLDGPYTIPFDWYFYGELVSNYKIAHDGYITFENGNGASIGENTSLPDPSGPNNAIYAMWDNFGPDAVISMKTYGESPTRVHTITWASMGEGWGGPTVSVKLYESCGDFEVVLNDGTTSSCTIGCENADGTLGTQVNGSPNYEPIDPGYSAANYEVNRFSWNGPIVNDASLIGVRIENHLSTGNHILAGAVRNEGTSTLDSYNINYTLNGGPVQTTLVEEADTIWTGDFSVVITTVDWAEEISWDITNSSGDVLAYGTGYADGNEYIIPLCVPPGDCTFNWYDSYGDGWNGCGYEVYDNAGNLLTSDVPTDYTYGGSSTFTSTGSSCDWYIESLVSNSKKSFWTHEVPINISSPSDSYELKMWVSEVNDTLDEMSCNDTLVEYITGFSNNSAEKKTLIEEWTGTWCAYCIDGAVVMDDLDDQYGEDIIPVVVHDGDPMEIDDNFRYAFTATAYPSATIDRYDFENDYSYVSEELGRGAWGGAVSQQQASFTPVGIEIDFEYNASTRVVNGTVNLNYTDNSAGDARIVLMVIEDNMVGSGSDWDQANAYNDTPGHPYYGAGNSVAGFNHRHVLRDYVEADCFGVDGVIPHFVEGGSTYSHDFTYEVPTSMDDGQVNIVAAVVRYIPTNDSHYVGVRGQRSVLNAEQIDLVVVEGVYEVDNSFFVFPNPTTGIVNFSDIIEYEIYSPQGKLLLKGVGRRADLSELPTGMYILSNGDSVIKIIKK
jgi:thiol-disulfide isomerase/thioredoxin